MSYGDENTAWARVVDGNDLYGVPEDHQLDEDPPEPPNEPFDPRTVRLGEVQFIGED